MTESAIYMSPDHVYTWTGDGEHLYDLPSVTTIAGTADDDLGWWHARMAAEYAIDNWGNWAGMADRRECIDLIAQAADRYRDGTADVGTRAHTWCEQRALAEIDPPEDKDIQGHAFQFEKFLTDFAPVYERTEAVVFSRKHLYAGTLDAIAEIPGYGRTLIDIKTGRTVRAKVALQLAALANADFIGTPDGTCHDIGGFDTYAVLHLRPRSHHLIPVTVTGDEHLAFLYCQQVRSFNLRSPALLGDPLTPKVPV